MDKNELNNLYFVKDVQLVHMDGFYESELVYIKTLENINGEIIKLKRSFYDEIEEVEIVN